MRFLGSAPCWVRIPAHGSKKLAIVRITGFSFQMVPHPTGCSRAAGIARFRCVASLLARCRGCHGGDRGRRLLAGPDLRRHPVLCVTGAFDFALEGVSPVRGPFFVARVVFEHAVERAFRAGHLESCNLFWACGRFGRLFITGRIIR